MKESIKRTTIDLDMNAVDDAMEILGTSSIRETVDVALREVARRKKLRELAELIRQGKLGAPTPEQLVEMRRNPHVP